MEIPQQNGSVWLRPWQSTHKKTVLGKISSLWFLVKAPRAWGKQPKWGTSCSLLEIFCGIVREERESWWAWKGRQGRNWERSGAADCLSNASFPTLSILWKKEEGKHTPKLLCLLFMQYNGNDSNGNFSCSFTFPEFSCTALCVCVCVCVCVCFIFFTCCSNPVSICVKNRTNTQCYCGSSFA